MGNKNVGFYSRATNLIIECYGYEGPETGCELEKFLEELMPVAGAHWEAEVTEEAWMAKLVFDDEAAEIMFTLQQ